ncbi:MAG: sigma-70 family RNA polymerase sigma factor [Rikenellaceae bacterium]
MCNTDYNTLSGNELFLAIQRGDESAFTAAYFRYAEGLHVLAYRYLKDDDLANNAVQHVFVRLWEYRQEITISSSLQNYLFTMAKNYIMNQIRSNNKLVDKSYEYIQSRGYAEDNLLNLLDQGELHSRLLGAISRLPAASQNIVNMKIEGSSNQEIADQLHIPLNTVKSKYSQSIKLLRAMLAVLSIILLIN